MQGSGPMAWGFSEGPESGFVGLGPKGLRASGLGLQSVSLSRQVCAANSCVCHVSRGLHESSSGRRFRKTRDQHLSRGYRNHELGGWGQGDAYPYFLSNS